MEKMLKRLLSFAVALAMVISWLPGNLLQAEAAEESSLYGDSTSWSVWNGEDITQSGSYKLEGNVDLTELGTRTIPAGVTVAIDLCGFSITAKADSRAFTVRGKLIVQDSSTEQSGKIIGGTVTDNCGNIQISSASAVFELYSGTVTGGSTEKRGGNIYVNAGTFNMYGGTVSGGRATDIGGNIYITQSGSVNISGGTVSGGVAGSGGNICNMYSHLTVSGGEIFDGSGTYGGNIELVGYSKKYPVFTITGGTIGNTAEGSQGGSFYTEGSASADTAAVLVISGGTMLGETYVKSAASLTLSGAPVVENLRLGSGTLVTPTEMEAGASVTVQTASGTTAVSGVLKNAESYLPYFFAYKAGYGVGVSNNTLVITDGCICGCGAAASAVQWQDLNTYLAGLADDKLGYLETDGHYYLSGPLDLTGIPTLEIYADVTLDLRGQTITPAEGSRTIYINTGHTLNVMDSAGGGQIIGGKISGNGGAVYVGSKATLKLFGGTITGGSAPRGGNLYLASSTSAFYMYGGTVSKGTGDQTLTSGTATTNGRGGNIFSWGNVYISGGTVTGGTATNGSGLGGNIYISNTSSALYISGSAKITKGSAKSGGNIALMYANVNISGGTVSGGSATSSGSGIFASGTSDSGNSSLIITGGTVKDELYGYLVKELVLSGTPVIENLRLASGMLVAADGLEAGASITVQTASSDNIISGTLTDAAGTAEYFHAYADGSTVAAVDNVLKILEGCPCGCEGAMDQITWKAWSGGSITASGHYYLSRTMTLSSAVKIASGLDVVLDLRGRTLTAASGCHSFEVSGKLSILDTVTGGKIVGSTYAGNGGNIYLNSGSTMNLYSGTITGGTGTRGGNIYVYHADLNMYGGTVSDGAAATGDAVSSDNRGGNIYVETGTFHMYDGTVSDGKANRGGNIGSTGTVRVSGGTVSGGNASWSGGNIFSTGLNCPVYISGTAQITGGNGNGIYLMYSTLYVSGGTVEDAVYAGKSNDTNYGAIYISGGTVSGDIATSSNYGGEKHVLVISGGSLTGTTNLTWTETVVISGAPTIKNLSLAEGMLLTPVDLSADAKITLTDATGVFTTTLENAESYKSIIQYSGSKTYMVHNDALALFSITSSGTCGNNLTWTLTDTGVLIISGTGAMTDFYRYSDYLNDVPWDNDRAKITSVVIESGVTNIGDNAFYDCYNLTDITIPDTVTSIGAYAFRDCTSLTEIALPNTVTSIGNYAFRGCTGLTEMTIPAGVKTIGTALFYDCTSLTSITIPSSVTTINGSAFRNCNALSNVYYLGTQAQWDAMSISTTNNTSLTNLETTGGVHYSFVAGSVSGSNVKWKLSGDSTLTIYGTGAMANYYHDTTLTRFTGAPWREYADQITTVVISSGVTTIGDWAFYGLKNLTSVTISDTVTAIGSNAFRGCTGLETISIPGSVTEIGNNAFQGCTGLTAITGCTNVTGIGAYAFYGCTGLQTFTVPAGVTELGDFAFGGCAGLTAITVAVGNTSYTSDTSGVLYSADMTTLIQAPGALSGSYTVPAGVTTIGHDAFSGCHALTGITVADSVETIAGAAFDNCTALETINLGTGVTTIGSNAFAGCDSLTAIQVAAENASYASDEAGALYSKDMTTLVQVPGGISGSYTVAESVTAIGEGALAHNPGLTEVTLPSAATSVGKWAFSCSENLAQVTLPTGVTAIKLGVFEHTGLTDVYYLGETAQWSAVSVASYNEPLTNATIHCVFVDNGTCGDGLTWTLTSDGVLTISGTGEMKNSTGYTMPWYAHKATITAVVIDEGVTSIGEYAFADCTDLTAVTIPKTVTTIGSNAFSGCTGLADVVYGGSEGLWSRITIGDGNEALTNAAITYTPATPVSLQVKTLPSTLNYTGQEELDTTGLVLLLTYDDTSTAEITEGYEVSYDFSAPGTRTVTVTYGALTTTFDVTVTLTGTCGDNLTWTLTGDGKLTITGTGEMTYYDAKASVPWFGYKEIITSVVINEGMTGRLSRFAFYTCTNLTSVVLPEGVTFLGSSAFYGCSALTEVVVPSTVTGISSTVFGNCSSLTTVTLGEKLTSIGEGAFRNCTGLTTVYYGGSRTTWQEISVNSTDNSYLTDANIIYARVDVASVAVKTMPAKVEYYLNDTLDTTGLVLTVTYDDGSTADITEGYEVSYDFSTAGTQTVTVTYGEKTAAFDVTVILGGIGSDGLTWVLTEGVLTISGTGAMADYSAETAAPWAAYAEQITSVEIGEAITAIGSYAFYGCGSLTGAAIPEAVTVIGENAFNGCTTLESVLYGGSSSKWSAVTIGENNEPLTAATIVCAVLVGDANSDGAVTPTDATSILKWLAAWDVTLSEDAADVNGDGAVTPTDATSILKWLAVWNVTLG